MIGCWIDEAFAAKVDRARGAHTRSQFCRDAIASKLKANGYKVFDAEIYAPDRKGKGGPRKR